MKYDKKKQTFLIKENYIGGKMFLYIETKLFI